MSSRIALAQSMEKHITAEVYGTATNALRVATQQLERAFNEMELVTWTLPMYRKQASTHARNLADTLSGAMQTLDALAPHLGFHAASALTPNVFSAFTRAETLADLLARQGSPRRVENRLVDATRSSLKLGSQELASISLRLMYKQDFQPTYAQDTARPHVYRLTLRLTSLAARLLPPADRPRYAEEFQSELHELAQISGRAQLTYAARLLARAIPLRHELHRTAHKVAGEQ